MPAPIPLKFNWKCPFCNHAAIIIGVGDGSTYSAFEHVFNVGNNDDTQLLRGIMVGCPNADCKQFTLEVSLHKGGKASGVWVPIKNKGHWQLIPESRSKVFPAYIPEAILEDYREACLIRDKSPKASATLSRRCLQGMIRDFWGIKKARLIDEIVELELKVDSETWAAIDGVRQIGNIGAHMEKDINIIVDVEPDEAQLLIELIETLLTEWYVAKHDRQLRMAAVRNTASSKKAQKAPALQTSAVSTPASQAISNP